MDKHPTVPGPKVTTPASQASSPPKLTSVPPLPSQRDQLSISGAADASAEPKPIWYIDPTLEPSPDDPMSIRLHAHHPLPATQPQEMRDLIRDIFAVEHLIRILFHLPEYTAQRKEFFEGLSIAAKTGLSGSDFNIERGRLNLSLTQDRIADEFPKLRDALWKSYFRIVVLFGLGFGVLGCLLYYHLFVKHVFADHNRALLDAAPAFPQVCLALVLIPFGVPIGIFLEFIFRVGEKISYDGLLAINPGRRKPWERTASTLITAYVFAFIVGIGAFQIGIAGILLNDFISTRPWLSVAVGFVTGLAFPYVADIVKEFKPERRDAAPRNGGPILAQGDGHSGIGATGQKK